MAFDDIGDSVLEDAEVAGDPAIAFPVGDGLEHPRRRGCRKWRWIACPARPLILS